MEKCLSSLETEFAIGLETANDLIRQQLIGKGFSFQDFVEASEIVHERGGRVKAYLLLKPPSLSEGEAMRDAIASARAARPFAEVLSLNLCNIQRNTYVERLWEKGEYRPPWLWSALEVLKSVPGPIVCDPVGAGTRRGPHNCGECDAAVAEAIRSHALAQDVSVFDNLDCACRTSWRELMDLEERAFGNPLHVRAFAQGGVSRPGITSLGSHIVSQARGYLLLIYHVLILFDLHNPSHILNFRDKFKY